MRQSPVRQHLCARMNPEAIAAICLVIVFVLSACATREPRSSAPPTRTGHLGTVHFPVSCSVQAQVKFDEAVALLHHMTYPQARAEFEQVAAIDPRCAMAHWGYAMTLFQPLWPTRPGAGERERGWQEV